jgi:hypothetical protein
VTNDGASNFRNHILQENQILQFIDFGNNKVFKSAGIQTMIYVLKKVQQSEPYNCYYAKLYEDNVPLGKLSHFLLKEKAVQNRKVTKEELLFEPSEFTDKYINFQHYKLLKRINDAGNFQLNEDEIFSGIDVLQDFVSKKHLEKLANGASKGDGIFVLNDAEIESLNLTPHERKVLKPYFTTKQIGRYFASPNNEYWIIYSNSDVYKNIEKFPAIKEHLDKYSPVMTSVNKPYGLHRSRNESIFQGEKVLSIRKCAQPSFTYVNFDCYVSRAFMIIKTDRINLEYLTAILNSKLVAFWLMNKGKLQGNQYQVDKTPLMEIPIKIESHESIVKIARNISHKEDGKKSALLESQLNQMVYELYGLNQSDIEVIEFWLNQQNS